MLLLLSPILSHWFRQEFARKSQKCKIDNVISNIIFVPEFIDARSMTYILFEIVVWKYQQRLFIYEGHFTLELEGP